MAGSLIVMASSKDGMTEGVIQGNTDMSLICENVVIIFPVEEMRLEGSGNIF